MHESCKGCLTYNKKDDKCIAFVPNLKGECPCSHCLVKTMCDDGCNKYDEYTDKYILVACSK
jgi:hypothetical protein